MIYKQSQSDLMESRRKFQIELRELCERHEVTIGGYEPDVGGYYFNGPIQKTGFAWYLNFDDTTLNEDL